mmetsp:Transcript_29798/g.81434  ORF Transcript_29798/g.81434 Transcript_29798/m.81434 type:complete len:1140 (-) Transcript_29798:313-3732(-)
MRKLSSCCFTLPPREQRVRPPLAIVRFIVRWPCLVATLSFLVPVVLAVIGWRIVISSAGPFGPFLQLNYPVADPVAMQSNAFILAREDADAVRVSSLDARRRRQLAMELPSPLGTAEVVAGLGVQPDAAELVHSALVRARSLVAEVTSMVDVAESSRALDAARGRHLSAGVQTRQSETMATALFAFRAYKEDGDAFSERGLSELCGLHMSLIGADGYGDYCLRGTEEVNGTEVAGDCAPAISPLSFFYGPPSYDPSAADLTVFDLPNFEEIMSAVLSNLVTLVTSCDAACQGSVRDDVMAQTGCSVTEYSRVLQFTLLLVGQFLPHWVRGEFDCSSGQRKDLEQVKGLVARIRASPALSPYTSYTNFFFDKHFDLAHQKSRFTRSSYVYGAPLAGYSTYISNAEKTDQEAEFAVWWREEKMRDAYCTSTRGCPSTWREVEPSVLISTLLIQELLLIAISDGIRAIIPVVLVFLIVWLHTGSLLLAFATLAEQILSFASAIFVTAGILQIEWMAFQQVLAIYIVLAIGADDVFVFVDAWRQSYYAGPEVNADLSTRLSWVYRRAGLAMLITSLTTCASFIATAASSSMPDLQNFGIFTAFVIFIDYVLVMTWFCAILVIWHNRFEMKPGLCCACCDDCGGKCCQGGCKLLCTFSNLETTTTLSQRTNPHPSEKSRVVRFFEDGFPFAIIKKLPARLTVLVAMVILLGPMLWQVSGIAPQTNPEQFLPDSHPFQRFFDANAEFDTSNEDATDQISLVWGFESEPLNTAGVNMLFDASFLGRANYRSDFTLDAPAQLAILGVCGELQSSPIVFAEFDSATSITTKKYSCWIAAFKEHREAYNLSFPVADDATLAILEWREAMIATGSQFVWDRDLGYHLDSGNVTLRWTRLRANSLINRRSRLPANELRVHYQQWEDFVESINVNAPASLGNAMQIAQGEGPQNKWIYMVLQELYVRMALVGIGTGLGIASIVLLLATRNLVVAALCIVTIGAVLVCVIGCTVAMGWQLGSVEALCFMTLTGFAVDYVVHLAHSYMQSHAHTSLDRAHTALQEMGISVFWGMATSFVASLVLATCQLQILAKFGLFFMLTIIFAYFWSVLFLMPLLATLGPSSKDSSSEHETEFPTTHDGPHKRGGGSALKT